MERREATALLEQLIMNGLVQPSFVSLKRNARVNFDLVIGSEYSCQTLRQFLAQRRLVLSIEKNYFVISKAVL